MNNAKNHKNFIEMKNYVLNGPYKICIVLLHSIMYKVLFIIIFLMKTIFSVVLGQLFSMVSQNLTLGIIDSVKILSKISLDSLNKYR